MHPACREWVRKCLTGWPSAFPPRPWRVVEVGSRDVNGSVRDLLGAVEEYVGLDLESGPNVTHAVDAFSWTPERPPHVVLCLQVLEHCPRAKDLVFRMLDWLVPHGGTLVLATVGPPWPPHSGRDGGRLRPGEHYAGITPQELRLWVTVDWMVERVSRAKLSHAEGSTSEGDAFALVTLEPGAQA